MALRILMAIPKIILTILLASLLLASLPFIILYYILAVPYIICKNSSGFRLRRYFLMKIIYRYYGWKYVFSWLGFLFLGILLSPITVAGALIASPFLLVKLVRDLWCWIKGFFLLYYKFFVLSFLKKKNILFVFI